jgi:hypothetical protein
MEKKAIPLDYIRGLVVAQHARCAITGFPLNPKEVNADHIIPLSREELNPSARRDNIWLVHKKINAMKGTMTYDEFVAACQSVLEHHEMTHKLLKKIQGGEIQPIPKAKFDDWVNKHCKEDGSPRSEHDATVEIDT